jgi:hypothetical protein
LEQLSFGALLKHQGNLVKRNMKNINVRDYVFLVINVVATPSNALNVRNKQLLLIWHLKKKWRKGKNNVVQNQRPIKILVAMGESILGWYH